MAAEKVLGDPHALDNSIQAMSHAEGMASLESGTVTLHLTSSPFIYQERENSAYTELSEISQVWPSGNTFLLAMASTNLEKDADLMTAVSNAFAQAIAFINENPAETAQIESQYLSLDLETVTGYLEQPDCQFFPEIRGANDMAQFMHRAGFIKNSITMDQFKFPSVIAE
jgi:NitT/TauT family transport system substrate-binding protein